jgi:AcrR family transcriptional regulator
MSPARPRQSSDQRRREILDAALDAFLAVGETGTFIHEVCRRAGVSVGTLYHHFGSKDQLIATLAFSLMDAYQSGAGGILEDDPPGEAGIRDTVAYHLNWLVGHPRQARFILEQPFAGYRSDRVPADLVRANQDFLALVHRWLDRRMESGEIRRLPFDLVVALLIAPVHHWVRGELFVDAERATRRAPRAVEVLADGAWQALRA